MKDGQELHRFHSLIFYFFKGDGGLQALEVLAAGEGLDAVKSLQACATRASCL